MAFNTLNKLNDHIEAIRIAPDYQTPAENRSIKKTGGSGLKRKPRKGAT
jgi:hypothetical protein